MPYPQLTIYLGFAASCLLGYVGWLWVLAKLRQRFQPSHSWQLNGRERLQLEQATGELLRQRVDRDATAREQFVRSYVQPVYAAAELVRQHADQNPATVHRFLSNAIRQLDDLPLRQLAQQLGCLPTLPCRSASPLVAASAAMQPPRTDRRIVAHVAITAGSVLLTLLLVFPPWVVVQQRHTYLIGEGPSIQVLRSTPVGHRCFSSVHIPKPQVTHRTTNDLRTIKRDETVWQVHYGRLMLLASVLTLLVGGMTWQNGDFHTSPGTSLRYASSHPTC